MKARIACALLVAATTAGPASAQSLAPPPDRATAGEYFAVGAANALLSGVAAGVEQKLRGGSFSDGFTRGAAAGAVSFGGKWIVAHDFTAAGLLGREVAAVGHSLMRNAAEARPAWSRLVLPIGPVRLYIEDGLRAKLDLATTAVIVWGIARPELTLDLGESLSSGAPVFRSSHLLSVTTDGEVTGLATFGAILAVEESTVAQYYGVQPGYMRDVLAHERVHVVQHDFAAMVAEPVETWLAGVLPGLAVIDRYADLNVVPAAFSSIVWLFGESAWHTRPWEQEADFLATAAR